MSSTLPSILLVISAALILGLALGFGYFTAVRHSAQAYLTRGPGVLLVALTLGRILMAAAFFAWAARFGLGAVVSAFAGFLIARSICIRRYGRCA